VIPGFCRQRGPTDPVVATGLHHFGRRVQLSAGARARSVRCAGNERCFETMRLSRVSSTATQPRRLIRTWVKAALGTCGGRSAQPGVGEASPDEQHPESVVVTVSEAAGDPAVEFDQAVDGYLELSRETAV